MKLATVMLTMLAAYAVPCQENEKEQKRKPSLRYALIINSSNKISEKGAAAKATVKRLFLKRLSSWPDGRRARPYGRSNTSAAQNAFVATILGMDDAELARHWLKVRNMTGATPPKEVASDRMIVKHIARNIGAFAVVDLDVARRAHGVRVLFEF